MKNEVIESAFQDIGVKLRDHKRTFRIVKSKDAFSHGKAAGDRVNITTGLNENTQKKIGG